MSTKRRKSTARMAETRPILAERCQGRCEHCGYTLPVDDAGAPCFAIHHRKLRSQGGADGPENCMAVLGPHHNVQPLSIHQNPADSIVNGWIVPRHEDPATTPALIQGRIVLLGTDGSLTPMEFAGRDCQICFVPLTTADLGSLCAEHAAPEWSPND